MAVAGMGTNATGWGRIFGRGMEKMFNVVSVSLLTYLLYDRDRTQHNTEN